MFSPYIESWIPLILIIFMWGIPLAAGVWIIYTLVHIRSGQQTIQNKLEAIERAIAKQL
jgi:hypothetical protein